MQIKLPEEIIKQIDAEAKKAATIVEWGEYDSGPASSARMAMSSRIDPIQKEFYIKGATEWAQWKVKYDELQKQLKAQDANVEILIESARRLMARCEKMEAALEWIKTYGPDQSVTGQAFIVKALAHNEGINEKEGEDDA